MRLDPDIHMRSLAVAALVVSLASLGAASCAPRHDIFLSWTIDGFPAAEAWEQLTEPKVRAQVESRELAGGIITEESTTLACADGTPDGAWPRHRSRPATSPTL